jgi:hypothetical protein
MSNPVTNTTVNYERWKGQQTRLGSKARIQDRLLPDDVFTCWEVNTESGVQATWSLEVATCGGCALFHGEKDLMSHLRSLNSNKDAPFRFRCESPWVKAHPNSTKRKSPSVVTTPPKKTKASATTPPPRKASDTVIASPTTLAIRRQIPPPARRPPKPATPSTAPEAETLTSYLMRRLEFKEQAIKELTSRNAGLLLEVDSLREANREQEGFFNASSADGVETIGERRDSAVGPE